MTMPSPRRVDLDGQTYCYSLKSRSRSPEILRLTLELGVNRYAVFIWKAQADNSEFRPAYITRILRYLKERPKLPEDYVVGDWVLHEQTVPKGGLMSVGTQAARSA